MHAAHADFQKCAVFMQFGCCKYAEQYWLTETMTEPVYQLHLLAHGAIRPRCGVSYLSMCWMVSY